MYGYDCHSNAISRPSRSDVILPQLNKNNYIQHESNNSWSLIFFNQKDGMYLPRLWWFDLEDSRTKPSDVMTEWVFPRVVVVVFRSKETSELSLISTFGYYACHLFSIIFNKPVMFVVDIYAASTYNFPFEWWFLRGLVCFVRNIPDYVNTSSIFQKF